jgi:hypothetical protein
VVRRRAGAVILDRARSVVSAKLGLDARRGRGEVDDRAADDGPPTHDDDACAVTERPPEGGASAGVMVRRSKRGR